MKRTRGWGGNSPVTPTFFCKKRKILNLNGYRRGRDREGEKVIRE